MTGSYALIQKGIVINTIAWDGPEESPIEFPEGVTYVEFPDGDGVSPAIGWSFDGKTFSAPPLSDEEIAAQNQQKIDSNTELKASLIAQATLTIDPLQDAVDLEMATDDEKTKLTAWKKYRVLLMRVDTSSASDIEWPDAP